MRRRRLLAVGAAAVGLAGCAGNDTDGTMWTPSETTAVPDAPAGRSRGAETTGDAQGSGPTPSIGGSLNGRPFRLGDDVALVEESETEWIHAFLDVREKHESRADPREDPDVVGLRRASRDGGANLFVTLQWDFVGLFDGKGQANVPEAGSSRERALFEYGTDLLTAIGEPVDVVGLGNEPVWETKDEDFLGQDAPLVQFTRDLKDHLVEHYPVDDTRLVVGALNRLYTPHVRDKYGGFYDELLEMARTDDDVDGIDVHVHYETLQQAQEMLEVARRLYPEGLLTATEFSPMWRYNEHKNDPIASFEGGDSFARRHGIPGGMTVSQYFQAAKVDQPSRREIADFYDAMPWYNVNFVDDMYDLLDRYDVSLGTFGFLVDDGATNVDWTEDWAPFQINCLFQPPLIDTEHGAHPHYIDDFRRRS